MLRSMTGFGSASGEVDGVEFSVEVRSVNNRYLKPMIKAPEGFSALEPTMEKRLRRQVTRGTVTLAVRMKLGDEQAAYRVNSAALGNYIEQLRPLELEANPMLRVDLGNLMQLPGVCEPPPLDDLRAATQDGLLALVDEALERLGEMRRREGDALGEDLAAQCDAIERLLGEVGERAPHVVQEYHERLATRVQELMDAGKYTIDSSDLAREVAIFAERSDINEEITRLSGHVKEFREAMKATDAVGRKLDFIAQEMLREANTIASKSNDSEIGRRVVDIKTAIDRIKEQVQNAE